MDNALIPYKDIEGMADAVVKSRLFPSIQSREAAMTLMLLCQAENIHPMMALRRYDIIQGRPALKSDAMLAEFQKRGGKVRWLRLDDECAEAEFMSAGLAAPVKIKFDTADAKRAGLLGKDNWNKYPRAMRRARVISEGIRTADPGVNAGVYTPEEVADFDQPKVVQVEAEVIEAPASEHEPPVDEAPPPSDPTAGGELFGQAGGPQEGESGSIGAAPPAEVPPPPEKKVTDGVEMGNLLFKMVRQLETSHPFCKCGDVMIAKLDKKGQPYGTCRTLWDALIAGDDTKSMKKDHDYCRLRKDIVEGVPF